MRLLLAALALALALAAPSFAKRKFTAKLANGPKKNLAKTLCQGDPKLDKASFDVAFTARSARTTRHWTFRFDHCAQMKKSPNGPPLQIQRIYKAEDGQGFFIATDVKAAVSHVSLGAFSGKGKDLIETDLGLLFNSELTGAKPIELDPVATKDGSPGKISITVLH